MKSLALFQKTPFIFLLICALYLNFLELLENYTSLGVAQNWWVFIPLAFMLTSAIGILRYSAQSIVALLILSFLFILAAHSILQFFRYEYVGAGWAFLSYGLWLGVVFWMSSQPLDKLAHLLRWVVVLSALVHFCAVMLDRFYFGGVLKTVTIAEVERSYGIATSIAIMSTQLGVAVVLLVGIALRTYGIKCILSLALAAALTTLMLTSSVRGPILYLAIALATLVVLRLVQGTKLGELFLMSAIALSFLAGVTAFLLLDVDRATFFLELFDTSSEGNAERLLRYQEALLLLREQWWTVFIGHGSSELTHIPNALNRLEFSSESSLVKSMLELGLIGLFPIIITFAVVLFGAATVVKHPVMLSYPEFIAALLLICLQCLTHETFKTWIGSMYFALFTGFMIRALIETGFIAPIQGDNRSALAK